MKYSVVLSVEALNDLIRLQGYIAEQSSPERAYQYVARIYRFVNKLALFPNRGVRRDDIRLGVRIVGFERRVAIAFLVSGEQLQCFEFFTEVDNLILPTWISNWKLKWNRPILPAQREWPAVVRRSLALL